MLFYERTDVPDDDQKVSQPIPQRHGSINVIKQSPLAKIDPRWTASHANRPKITEIVKAAQAALPANTVMRSTPQPKWAARLSRG